MLLVFATRVVLCMMPSSLPSGRVIVSWGKSIKTSAISFPLSPHPTYTMPSELLYLDRACEITVLPHPKAPGMQHVPPKTEGKSVSSTLCPVSRGVSAMSFLATGLGLLTGQFWTMVYLFFSPLNSSSKTSSFTAYCPAGAT